MTNEQRIEWTKIALEAAVPDLYDFSTEVVDEKMMIVYRMKSDVIPDRRFGLTVSPDFDPIDVVKTIRIIAPIKARHVPPSYKDNNND